MRLHETLGLVAAALALLHPTALLATGRWRDYRPPRHPWRAVTQEIARTLQRAPDASTTAATPRRKPRLNPAQRLVYAPLVAIVLPGLAITGLLLLAPAVGVDVVSGPRTRATLATVHAALALVASLFSIVHLYMARFAEPGRMLPWRRRLAVGLLAALVASATSSGVAEERRFPPLPCLGCHSGTPTSRRIVTDARTGAHKDVTVVLAQMAEGVHGRLACPTCHDRGFDRFPHRPPAERRFPACRDCHPRSTPAEGAAVDAAADWPGIEAEHATTAHAGAFRRVRGERDCEACHHPHVMRRSADLARPERLRADHDAPCLSCHGADAQGPLADPMRPDPLAVHAAVPHARAHLAAVRCVDCHASRGRAVAHDLLDGRRAAGCVDCHRDETVLVRRLYRFVTDEPQGLEGFTNRAIAFERYVPGATRWQPLDRAILGATALVLVGIAAHALARGPKRRRDQG